MTRILQRERSAATSRARVAIRSVAIAALALGTLACCGTRAVAADGVEPRVAAAAPEDGSSVRVEGIVRLVGSAPFPVLVLSDAEGRDWYLDEAGQALLRSYERRTVTVEGVFRLRRMILADGTELAPRWELTDLVLRD